MKFVSASPLTGPEAGLFLQPFRKPKRIRTAFSPSQLLRLEHAFEKNHYVVGQERKELAATLSLTETQVRGLIGDTVVSAWRAYILDIKLQIPIITYF